jgi:hypothetical protein
MSVGVDSDYEKILNKLITEQRAVLLVCLAQFDELAEMIKFDKDFTDVRYSVINDDTLQYEATYKLYRNYRFYFRFDIEHQCVELDVRNDRTNKEFAGPTDDALCIKYFNLSDLDGNDETFKARAERLIKIAKERVDEEVERDNKRSKGYLTAEEFTDKVQDLMHPDKDSYLFVDPISGEQANKWFYDKLVEKIKAHPKIWKWFFTV